MMGAKITDELIERVAIAMFDRAEAKRPKTGFQWSWNDFTDGSDTRLFWRGEARAALEAALTAPDKQEAEPVAWFFELGVLRGDHPTLPPYRWQKQVRFTAPVDGEYCHVRNATPLYPTPAISDDALRAEYERLRDELEAIRSEAQGHKTSSLMVDGINVALANIECRADQAIRLAISEGKR